MAEHELMTVEEVAAYLRVSERTIYDWAQKRAIPAGKFGTTWRFKRAEIEKWVNDRLSSPTLAPSRPERNGIAAILATERVLMLETDRKTEALGRLVDALAQTPEVEDRAELVEAVFRREELMSTGIGFGVAVPHVRLASVRNVVMAVGLSREPITDYESLDGRPVRLVFMVAAGKNQHAQYLRTLSSVSAMLKDETFREQLLAQDDAEQVFNILTR